MAASTIAMMIGMPGCEAPKDRVPLFPAAGQVMFGDQPAAGVEVRFFDAADPKNPDLPHPYATTGPDGRFRLSTFEDGDGAPAGNYRVMLLWPEGPPGPGVPRDRLGRAFTDPTRSPFQATVDKGTTSIEPFRIDPASVKKEPVRLDDAAGPVNPQNPSK